MRLLLALAVVSLTSTACTTMDATECRSASWYDIGFRDGLAAVQRMDVVYDDQCSRHGAKLDVVAYARGWQEGLWENESRRRNGGME